MRPRFILPLLPGATALVGGGVALAQPINLEVDAREAPRGILHAQLHIPAQPGKLTLLYPKWLPGEHEPDGPITDLAGLKVSAGGKEVEWRRDAADMYAFHVTVPPAANLVEVALDFLLPVEQGAYSSGASATAKLLDLNWNQVVLYPKGSKPSELQYEATLRLPQDWQFGTALPVASSSTARVQFSSASLETLVDSPLVAGEYFRTVDLTPRATSGHWIHIVADSAAALEMKPEDARHFSHLVAEANVLFGAHHYRGYHFLLTLSDHVAHFGLEHHESSDNRVGERFLIDPDLREVSGSLLPHEMTHSWNGKYRRPAGLATPDFQQPMEGELLWIYEGLTTHLGNVLAARSGLWTNETFREDLAYIAAMLDHQPGRDWRPLSDTAVAAQLLYNAPAEGAAWRRKTDFYPEGALIWLEADTIIREQSKGQHSLDDFCKSFYGGESGPPRVVPYKLDDVVSALTQVVAYPWREFFQKRVYEIEPRAPMGGIQNSGWHVAYTNKVPALLKARESARKFTDMSFSLGLLLKEDGYITDVWPGSPAQKAGIGPGSKLVAVNGRRWTPEILRTGVAACATNHPALELLVEHDDYFQTCRLDYHEGERYPILEREPGKPDMLSQILSPLTPEPAEGTKKR